MEILGVESWLFWFVLGMVLIGAEVLVTGAFYAGSVSLAALASSLTAGLDGSIELQILVFSVVAGLSILFIRPVARRHLIIEDKVKVGHEALVGRRAVVLQEVTVDNGRVKIDGDVWSARVEDESVVLPVGARVEVVTFRGAYAIVAGE